jgi:flavin-binding protein dodecin
MVAQDRPEDDDEQSEAVDPEDAEVIESEGPPRADRDAHDEAGASEYSRREGGALISEIEDEQFAERDRSLNTEQDQEIEELGAAFLTHATQTDPIKEEPEPEQPQHDDDVDWASTGERYTREQVPGAEVTRERLITRFSDDEQPHARIDEPQPEDSMSVAKVTEITSESTESFDAAIREGIEVAGRTIQNIRNVWVKDQQVVVRDNKPERYRVDLKVTFVLNDR